MEIEAYQEIARIQSRHWWFRARRDILAATISRLPLPQSAEVLEIGCGAGGNLPMLKSFGHVSGVEMDEFARSYAERHSGVTVVDGSLPGQLPTGRTFDLICLFDVLEHVKEDTASLEAIRQLLRSEGVLLMTVPAYGWLFGRHDQFLHHQRRYSMAGLREILLASGYEIDYSSYFNTLLFPLVAATRLIELITRPKRPVGNQVPWAPLNGLLYGIFGLEKRALRFARFPFGASIVISATRRG